MKVPDNKNEHPQVGINDADIVFVQLDGYVDSTGQSSTRLMPVYHSRFPEGVGPVRSIRPVDIPLLAPMHAVIASTGAAPWVEKYALMFPDFVDGSATYMKTKGTGSFSIDPSRVRVYQGQKKLTGLSWRTGGVSRSNGSQTGRRFLLPYAASADVSTPPMGVRQDCRGAVEAGRSVRDELRVRRLRGLISGTCRGEAHSRRRQRVTTDNVLLIMAKQSSANSSRERWQEPIHEIEMDRTNIYANGGRYVTGKWEKGAIEDVFNFTLDDGSPLLMAPGRTFVELLNTDAEAEVS